jgi:hypothetical protein
MGVHSLDIETVDNQIGGSGVARALATANRIDAVDREHRWESGAVPQL